MTSHIWYLLYGTIGPFHRQENRGLGEQTCGCPVGCLGNLGFLDANYCLWNGWAMRSCCGALRTMSRHLWRSLSMGEMRMGTCMCDWATVLYSRKNILLGKYVFFNHKSSYLKEKIFFPLSFCIYRRWRSFTTFSVDVTSGGKSLYSGGHLSESRRKVKPNQIIKH